MRRRSDAARAAAISLGVSVVLATGGALALERNGAIERDAGRGEESLGATRIAGRAVSCTDIRGRAVHTMQVANLGDVGRAGVINKVPVIAIDPNIIGRLPDKLQLFFYQHECAHHVLGHWFQMSLNMETEADCWAIRHGRDNDIFSRDDVMSFAPFLAESGGSPFGHLPGPERAKFLLTCFDGQ